jgi:hypothetical protein
MLAVQRQVPVLVANLVHTARFTVPVARVTASRLALMARLLLKHPTVAVEHAQSLVGAHAVLATTTAH